MSALGLAFAFALPLLAGWVAVGRVGLGAGLSERALQAGMAIALGLGSASLFAYAWLVAGGALGAAYAVGESVLFLAVLALLWRLPSARQGAAGEVAAPGADAAVAWVVGAGIVAFAVAWALDASGFPHGDWDAWAIWNQRARFLLRGGSGWRAAFSPELAWSHPGYPLLVPGAVARTWAIAGETLLAPAVMAALFTLAPVLVVFGAIARRSGAVAAGCAALLLIATDAWRTWGTSQDADVPLAAFAACAAAALVALPSGRGTVLAGVFLGLAGWTKDEGLVLATLFAAWTCLRAGRGAPRALALIAVGGALPLLARLHFQVAVAPVLAAVFTEGQSASSVVGRLLDPGRWATILRLAPGGFPGLGSGLAAVAFAMPWLLGARPRDLLRSPVVPPVFGVYAAYLLAWAVTPLPLEWHVQDSARRVLLQPWPALLMGLMALAPPPRSGERTTGAGAGAVQNGASNTSVSSKEVSASSGR